VAGQDGQTGILDTPFKRWSSSMSECTSTYTSVVNVALVCASLANLFGVSGPGEE